MKSIRRVYGNINGLKSQIRRRIGNFYRRKIPPAEVVSPEVARDLARLSFECGRQLGLLVARDGSIEMVLAGESRSLYIPELPKSRSGRWRLRGLRLVHTHLKEEPIGQDDLMDLVFLRLDCVAVIRTDTHGGAKNLEIAHILPGDDDLSQGGWTILPLEPCANPSLNFLELIESLEEELDRKRASFIANQKHDRAILVIVSDGDRESEEANIAELIELAKTAGITVADCIIQKNRRTSSKYLIGKGKLSEIMVRALQCGVDLLIFDRELNPSQVRSLTDMTELRVIDRTQLILDIFAQRAQSREGKIQVEMAQLKYLLPRLDVKDDALSRLRGGIGMRGPGETKLEIDKRRIKDRIAHLERQLDKIRRSRSQRRIRRLRRSVPVISIVGYTNAGKSTLLNTLTNSKIFVEDQLFATLDPTSRRLRFPRDTEVIITDTVGFIKDLPDDLMEAFAATLEELDDADLLLHVVDVSNPRFEDQIEAVEKVLAKLSLDKKPTLLVLNKIDLLEPERVEQYARRYNGIPISAISSNTLEPLIRALHKWVEGLVKEDLPIPSLPP